MLAEAPFPTGRGDKNAICGPRVICHPVSMSTVWPYASPNALSAYHRMGLTTELEGVNLVTRRAR